MDMNNTHTHTHDCIAVNELNEYCCSVDPRTTRDTCRHTVELRHADDSLTELHTFTDDDDDAVALAKNVVSRDDNFGSPVVSHRITYRDTDHVLDDLAHPSFIRDVPNPE